jgi:beta-glucosidase
LSTLEGTQSVVLRATALLGSVVVVLSCSQIGDQTPGSITVHPEIWPRVESAVPPDAEVERRVDELLATLTEKEKVGQLIQAGINSVTPQEVKKYRLGSVLNGGGGWPGNRKSSTPEDWLALADAFWEASMDTSEGGQAVPILWGLDAVHGHNNVIGATLFPHNVGLGAANNPDLVRRIGEITATEVAVTGQDWTFAPSVAVARDSRWGRAYESYSEDPEIVEAYARTFVEGLQVEAGSHGFLDDHHLIATAKHFLGDGGTKGGVDQGDNLSTEEQLRDIHGAGYVGALEAGAQTVMASFSSWHGQKMHGNKELLTDVLKGRMGFDGFVVGDWNGHGQVPGCTNEDCAAAFNAGVDMFMVPRDWRRLYENTLRQVESGEISMERLDDAVRRILRVKMRAGLFDRGKPSSRSLGGSTEILGSPEHREVARQAVRESLVLLKNEGGLLPLSPRKDILVAGDGADDIGKQTGGWTITWQGTGNSNEEFPGATSIWDGIRERVQAAGGTAVLSPAGDYEAQPDAAIVVFGEDPYAEFQGDVSSVDYRPTRDLALLRRLQEDGIPVISVFLTGRPLWVNPELNASDAFVVAWLPGTEGAGVADVLLADADGSPRHDIRGRLSFSWPRHPLQSELNRGDEDYDPLFPYGYGLTWAETAEWDELSEEAGDLPVESRTVYFDGGPVPPWRLYIGDAADWRVSADGPRTTTVGSENLVIEAVDRRVQEDTRVLRWSGDGMATVYLLADDPLDLTREVNAEMAIAFDAYLEMRPSSAMALRMECGDSCSGEVDLTKTLADLPLGEWTTIAIRLRCFEEAGADMKRIESPFTLATKGSASLRVSDIRLVWASEGEADCP